MTKSLLIQKNKNRANYQLASNINYSPFFLFYSEYDLLYYDISFSNLSQSKECFYHPTFLAEDGYTYNKEKLNKYITDNFEKLYYFFQKYYNFNVVFKDYNLASFAEKNLLRFHYYYNSSIIQKSDNSVSDISCYAFNQLIPANRNIYVSSAEELKAVFTDAYIYNICEKSYQRSNFYIYVHLTKDISVNKDNCYFAKENKKYYEYRRRLMIIGHNHFIIDDYSSADFLYTIFNKRQLFFKQCKFIFRNNVFGLLSAHNVFVDCTIIFDKIFNIDITGNPNYSLGGNFINRDYVHYFIGSGNRSYPVSIIHKCKIIFFDINILDSFESWSKNVERDLSVSLTNFTYCIMSQCSIEANIYFNASVRYANCFLSDAYIINYNIYLFNGSAATLKDNVFTFNHFVNFNNTINENPTKKVKNYFSCYLHLIEQSYTRKNIDIQNNKVIYNYKITDSQNNEIEKERIIVEEKAYDKDKFIDSRDENNTFEIHKLE